MTLLLRFARRFFFYILNVDIKVTRIYTSEDIEDCIICCTPNTHDVKVEYNEYRTQNIQLFYTLDK